jgi:thioredoxin 1
MAEIFVNEKNFDSDVLSCDIPVLVDFYAVWCGPCRMIAPIIAEIAEENVGKIKVCKLDVDEAPSIAARYGIESIPTLLVFKGGKIVNGALGYMPKDAVLSLIG